MHGVCQAVQEIDDAKCPDETPALQAGIENERHDKGRADDTDEKPGLELAPFRAGALNDITHDRIIDCVKNTGSNHDAGDGGQLG